MAKNAAILNTENENLDARLVGTCCETSSLIGRRIQNVERRVMDVGRTGGRLAGGRASRSRSRGGHTQAGGPVSRPDARRGRADGSVKMATATLQGELRSR